VVVAAALGGAVAGVASASEFTTPRELGPAVHFWIDVFTRYSSAQVVVHDRFEPGIVYRVVQAPFDRARLDAEVQPLVDRLTLARVLLPEVGTWLRAEEREPAGGERIRLQPGRREAFLDALAAERLYRPIVARALAAEGLPRELAALPLIESSYHPGAVSPAGAVGLWQLMRETAKGSLPTTAPADPRRDPALASAAAARHLRTLRDAFPNWPLALTAYHRGRAGVERARRVVGSDDLGAIVARHREPGFGFAARNYYAQFLAAWHVARNAETYFPELAPRRMVEYRVKRGDTLDGVARLHGVSRTRLRLTNGLRSAALQPGQRILIRL
jgi:membrane-bound lytic murein transglycosylase D